MATAIAPLQAAATLVQPAELVSKGFANIATILVLVAGAAAVIYLMWSGIQYIMAAGSPDKAKVARQGMINAIIGIVLVVSTYGIVRLATSIGSKISAIVGTTSGTTVQPGAAGTDTTNPSGTGDSPGGPSGGNTPGTPAVSASTTLGSLGFSQTSATAKWCRTQLVDKDTYPKGLCLSNSDATKALAEISSTTIGGLSGAETWYNLSIFDGTNTDNKWCRNLGGNPNCLPGDSAAWQDYSTLMNDIAANGQSVTSSALGTRTTNCARVNYDYNVGGTVHIEAIATAMDKACPPPYGSMTVSLSTPAEAATPTACSSSGFYWFTPANGSGPAKCFSDVASVDYASYGGAASAGTNAECDAADGFWYDSTCNVDPKPTS